MPLKITIAGQKLNKLTECSLKLSYDSVADRFAMKADFDPNSATDRAIFRPNAYQPCSVVWQRSNGSEFPLITGTVTGIGLSDMPEPTLNSIEGYSVTGILQDCQVCEESLQFDGLTIAQIAQRICDYFEINLVVDESVTEVCDTVNAVTQIDPLQTAANYLNDICRNYNIVLSHTATGALLLTSAKKSKVITTVRNTQQAQTRDAVRGSDGLTGVQYTTFYDNTYVSDAKPAFAFTYQGKGLAYTKMTLNTDAEKMHGNIYVLGQSQGQTRGILQTVLLNPYVPPAYQFFAPKKKNGRYRQRAVVNTVDVGPLKPLTARNVLADELKSISLTIEVQGWFLGANGSPGDAAYVEGSFIRPNILVSVQNPELYLFKANLWFVESVTLMQRADKQTAIMTCVLPQCFNNEEVTGNVFLV